MWIPFSVYTKKKYLYTISEILLSYIRFFKMDMGSHIQFFESYMWVPFSVYTKKKNVYTILGKPIYENINHMNRIYEIAKCRNPIYESVPIEKTYIRQLHSVNRIYENTKSIILYTKVLLFKNVYTIVWILIYDFPDD